VRVTQSVAPAPGDHGGDGPRLARALGVDPDAVLDLSLSLNPAAPDPTAVVSRHSGAVRRYPDAGEATEALAVSLRTDPARLVLTNGGAEAIALVAAELGAGWVDEPEFSLYARHLPALRRGAPRWRSDPHNPTGMLAAPGAAAEVWDEAFYPLATGRWTSGRADNGAVVLGSLTKVFACPGLRIGYVLGPDAAFAAAVRARQPRWAVNAIALATLPELLATADLPGWQREVARLRGRLVEVLARHQLRAAPSDANFVLVHGVAGLRDGLARHGVLVRDCASFGLAATVRIAVPDDDGLERLDAALARVSSLS
jgi:histidinol-phosphate/aromatic aminotransferase/cobyric acid decarboxylase-like protein